MDATVQGLATQLDGGWSGFLKQVGAVEDDLFHWAPGPAFNSVAILLRHLAGSERYWIGEAVGELRRFLVDCLRHNDLTVGDALLQAMDDIYDVLITIDYPDGMTGGLRRTTDVARGILEKTRGDLTVAARQDRLERQLRALESRILDAGQALPA